MTRCAACDHTPPNGARFCCKCGGHLAADAEAQALAEAMRARGFHVAPDGTVSEADLCRFKNWTQRELRRWRESGALPKAGPARPTRYRLRDVVAFIRSGEMFFC